MSPARARREKLHPRAVLTWHDTQRVAVEAMVAIETVRRWARGEPRMNSLTVARITRAMNKLGIRVGVPAGETG
jgi:hypothetical protein